MRGPRTNRRTALISGVAGPMLLSANPALSASVDRNSSAGSTEATAREEGPWAYWYWLDANITREGIDADLAAMHAGGVAGVYIFNIGGANSATLVQPAVETLTPLWGEMLRHAATRAESFGMQIALNICDGWGTAGGRWITPETSARQITWSGTLVEEGDAGATLPMPPLHENLFEELAVLAFPVPETWHLTSDETARVSTSWDIADPQRLASAQEDTIVLRSNEAGWVTFSFAEPFDLRSVTIRTPSVYVLPFLSVGYNGAANSLILEASDDGSAFRPVHQLSPPELGWQANLTTLNHSVPPVTARHFRLRHDPTAVRLHEFDGEMPVTAELALASITLSSRPIVDHLPTRSGLAWGIDDPLDGLVADADCIDPDSIIDLSGRLGPDGRLDWSPPDGRWAVYRIGATSTGKRTEPSGLAGGLECDKFDPATARLQFHGWFGANKRLLGEDLAAQVLSIFHIDSWEARSQNWSPVFAEEFHQRRGYPIGLNLLAMAGVPLKSATHTGKFLSDIRRTIADLVADNFFGTLRDLVHANGCLFSAQAMNASFPTEGMQHHAQVDIPCGEFWYNQHRSNKPTDVREAVSAARLYGKQLAGAEAWTGGLDWSEHPFSFKRQGDENFCYGINRLILHVWAHQAFPASLKPGITLFGLGSFFSQNQPWWPMAPAFIDYLTRCQHWLQQGHGLTDIGYFTGDDIPSRAFRPDKLAPPLPAGFDYDSVNPDMLLRLASVENGRIAYGSGTTHKVLVLPPGKPMRVAVLQKLAQLARDGAAICGPRPIATPTLSDSPAAYAALVEHLWGGAEPLIKPDSRLAELLGDPPIEAPAHILWTRRRAGEKDIVFLSNQRDERSCFDLGVRQTAGHPLLYDPVADRWSLPHCRSTGNDQNLAIDLGPSGSAILVFDREFPMRPAGLPGSVTFDPQSGAMLRQLRSIADLPDELALNGPWMVDFDLPGGPRRIEMPSPRDWTDFADPDIRHHSGTARYIAAFEIPDGADASWEITSSHFANLMRVEVNGRDMGVLWVPQSALDITPAVRPGRNHIALTLCNTWRNRLVGDAGKPPEERVTWILENRLGTIAPSRVQADDPLLPAGLLGPVTIRPYREEAL